MDADEGQGEQPRGGCSQESEMIKKLDFTQSINELDSRKNFKKITLSCATWCRVPTIGYYI